MLNTSLHGLRILNTRPLKQGEELNIAIAQNGGIAIPCPTLAIHPVNNHWLKSLPDLNTVTHAIFISANAIEYCFRGLQENQIPWPKHINIIAIGKSSARALKEFNLQAHEIPKLPNSESVLALDTLQQVHNHTVLLFKGNEGRDLIEKELLLKGAQLITLSVYKRCMPVIDQQFINSLWHDDAVDIILVTSEQSIHNLFKLFSPEAHRWLQDKPCVVLSERLAKAASLFGIKKIIISHPDRVMETLGNYKD